jgi:hypothetical protein
MVVCKSSSPSSRKTDCLRDLILEPIRGLNSLSRNRSDVFNEVKPGLLAVSPSPCPSTIRPRSCVKAAIIWQGERRKTRYQKDETYPISRKEKGRDIGSIKHEVKL